MSTTVTSQQVLDALQQDPDFGQPEVFPVISEFAAQLPEFVGDKLMDEQVTMTGMFGVCIKFMESTLASKTVLGDDKDIDEAIRTSYEMGVEYFKNTDVTAELAKLGVTERDALLAENSQFNDEAKRLYVAGELTYARLLVVNPAALLPRAA